MVNNPMFAETQPAVRALLVYSIAKLNELSKLTAR